MDNLCVPSNVSPTYAPAGQALVSATVVGAADADEKSLEIEVHRHLTSWFGIAVADSRHLRTYRIPWPCPRARAWSPPPSPCGGGPDSTSVEMVGRRRRCQAVGLRAAGGGGGDRGLGKRVRRVKSALVAPQLPIISSNTSSRFQFLSWAPP